MIKKKSTINIIVGVCFISLLLIIGLKIDKVSYNLDKAIAEDLPTLDSISLENYSLIAKKYQDKIKGGQLYRSRIRRPVAFINYDNEFNLIIFKIDSNNRFLLSQLFHVKSESVDRSVREAYRDINYNDLFNVHYRSVGVPPVGQIYMTFSGDSMQTVSENDSVSSFHIVCGNFSLRYGESDPVDIFIVGNEIGLGRTTRIPMDFLLLKRHNIIYLMVMAPQKTNSTIPPHLLYNIIMGI